MVAPSGNSHIGNKLGIPGVNMIWRTHYDVVPSSLQRLWRYE
jgi:hypothetical protein